MNEEKKLTDHWNEIKAEVKSKWNKISDEDLEKAKGSVDKLANAFQQKYGTSIEEAKKRMNDIVNKFSKSESMEREESVDNDISWKGDKDKQAAS